MKPSPTPKLPVEDEAFIHQLPKVELHIHIEGTLTPSLRWTLALKNNIPLAYGTYEDLLKSYNVTYNHRKEVNGDNGMPTFFEAYYGGMSVLRDEADFFDLAMEYFTKAAEMNVRYCEPFFDIQAHTRRGVPVEAVMNGLQRARKKASEDLNVRSNWTLCFLRDMSPQSAKEHYEACRPYQKTVFHAIGLDSNEYDRPPTLFDEIFTLAKHDGLHVTAHCDVGQKDTHEHIEQCLTVLCNGAGLQRLDHGLNAAEKPELIKLIKERGVGMTLVPHAYHRRLPTEAVFSKVRQLFDSGIPITISSDDPTYMHHMWVEDNLKCVRKFSNFSFEELFQLEINAVNICWADAETKAALHTELSDFMESWRH
ncbi:putative adenosine deaminase [Phaeomoniella chlamydospora]|uniref:Putative adenosine deaminase n=1 Tax=Phaeomoniella chlamydospora TaxID=158046 RepID=A0A0G2EZF8_PHACM|nr:putative adenosine deaminase [Phaeomoniella chlamydospora]